MNRRQNVPSGVGITFALDCEVDVPSNHHAVLSAPALVPGAALEAKDLIAAQSVSVQGKYVLDEHLEFLLRRAAIAPTDPLLVIGSRNSTVNWRAPVLVDGHIFAAAPERPAESRRSYFGIGARGGRLVFGEIDAADAADWDFFCAGVPVHWDGLEGEHLFDVLLTETADCAHLFDIPRGDHPHASEASRATFRRLSRTFLDHLHLDRATAARAMRDAIQAYPSLRRSANYLHAVIGGRADGSLRYLAAHGQLETLGRRLAANGCNWAVCLENSGSVMPTWLPCGVGGERIPLARAPNFRPAGRAVIVIRLPSGKFNSASLLDEDRQRAQPGCALGKEQGEP